MILKEGLMTKLITHAVDKGGDGVKITFRVWNPETKVMWYSDKLAPGYNQYMVNMDGELWAWRTTAYNLFEPVPMDDHLYMLSTGLSDRHGKEIYDGDILQVHVYDGLDEDFSDLVVVKWSQHWGMWQAKKKAWIANPDIKKSIHKGNIYENPGLLKGGKNDD